jgi:hypothetical protein
MSALGCIQTCRLLTNPSVAGHRLSMSQKGGMRTLLHMLYFSKPCLTGRFYTLYPQKMLEVNPIQNLVGDA